MTVNVTRERITPAMAQKYLENGKPGGHKNRKLSRKQVRNLCAAHRRGEWEDNGDTVKFDEEGNLIDGQHRMQMVAELGMSMDFWIARNLPKRAFETLDQQKRRSLSDVLFIAGEKYYSELSTAIRWNCAISGIIAERGGVTPRLGLSVLAKKPKLREAIRMACEDWRLKESGLISPGMAAALYYTMKTKDAKKADKFWQQVAIGEKLTQKSAAWKFRDILIKNKGSVEKLSRRTIAALAIKAWNAYRMGKNFNRRLAASDLPGEIK